MKYLATAILTVFLSFAARGQDLQNVAESVRQTYHIPAIAYAVVTPDSILEIQVLGYRRVGFTTDGNKAKSSDYFHLGSNTKAFTGFVAAHLVENNRIRWETKFFDLFPNWKEDSNPAFLNITLADLLSHRAGLKPYTSGLAYQQLPHFKGTMAEQRKQFVQHVLKEAPVQTEDRSYHYSNAGYSAAALMLEKITMRTWEQLIDEIVSEELHLNYKFGWPNRHDVNQPWGHWVENGALIALPPTVDYGQSLREPAGDISMPIGDYAKFIQLNLQGLTGKDNFLKAETYRHLHYGLKDYSIGWVNVVSPTTQTSEHVGTVGTFYCNALLDKKKKTAYIVICNSGTAEAVEGSLLLRDKLMEAYGIRNDSP